MPLPRAYGERMPSKLEGAYQLLRAGIFEQRYAPGQRLVEGQLGAELGVSRATLRTALVRLSQDGFVVLEPNRGASVRRCSPREVVDAYEAREVLEGFAAWLAARQAGPQDVQRMAAANEA